MTVTELCAMVGMTKQNYYKGKKERVRERIDKELVVQLVQAERHLQPEIGGRKLMRLIEAELVKAGVSLGRDRFFAILREENLLIKKRRRYARTTDSRHGMAVYANKLKEFEPTGPNQAWVSDLTYVRTDEGFVYLALVMDGWSRKIVGWDAGMTLEAEGCMRALKMALRELPEQCRPIHHSDRGCQYCCREYIEMLRGRGLEISMTEENHCYENAQAERLNGILKQEYGLGGTLRRRSDVGPAARQAVQLYNTRRPHVALCYKVPDEVHRLAA